MYSPDELLEQAHRDLARADHDEEATGLDRRQFMFYSLVAAAASTFGAERLRAQGATTPALPTGGRGGAGPAQQQQTPPVPLGNAEAPALQFQAYPGGTGALMEKLARERGRTAFDRAPWTVAKWTGPVPTDPETIAFLPAHKLASLLKARRITSVKLTEIYLDRLKRLNPTLLCAVTITEELARAQAVKADAEIAAGKYRGPLHGLPYGVKDLFATKGYPTTWGSADFATRIIDEDAEVVVRLREAGAVLVAKLATGLFAQNDQWFRGRTNNPWNLTQGSSGSSAGPASATAAGCVAFSIGTETSGSIVSPSIRCGLSALRPTFGRVSRSGGMVLSWSQDRVGPITRTVEDAAMVFNVIHGVDEKDPSTLTTPFHFDRDLKLAGLRIGVDPAGAPKEFVDKLRELGARTTDIGARPTVAGASTLGGLNSEYAAAFDEYVQRKAKEIGLDLNNLPAPTPPANGGRGGVAPYGMPANPDNPMAASDWNPRFVTGRVIKSMDFINGQRRRMLLTAKWGEFMKDLDMFIAGPATDVGANSQTGHPCVVVPYKFDVPAQQGQGGGRGGAAGGAGGASGAAPATPAPTLNAQPICATIIGAVFNDDKILGVAHQFQIHSEVVNKHPTL